MTYQLLLSILFFVSAVLLLFIGTVVLRDNPRRRLNRVTGMMLILVGLGPLFAAIGYFFNVAGGSTRTVSALTGISLVWELFFPQLILFSMVFPIERPFVREHSRSKFLIFIPHIFHVILASLFYDPDRIVSWLTADNPPETLKWLFDQFAVGAKIFAAIVGSMIQVHLEFFAVVNLVYVVVASVFLYQGYRRVTNPRIRTQTAIVIWGIRVAIGLYIIAFIFPILGIFELTESLQMTVAIVSLLTGVGSIVYAIVRYQFLDIRLLVRQSLVYTLTSGVLVGIYILIINQLGRITRSILGRDAPLIDVAFIIVALVFFQPVMTSMDNVIKRFFIRDRADFRNIAEQFSRQLATLFDLGALRDNVTSILKNLMLVENVWFCLYDWTSDEYHVTAGTDMDKLEVSFNPADPFIKQLREHQKPIPFEELLGATQAENSPCCDYVKTHPSEMIIPLQDANRVLGFVALSPKVSGYSYNYEDITTLNILGNQLVTAITNVWLYQESLEKQRLEKEMTLARQIQRDLLPKSLPCGEQFEFAAYTEPAMQVGGDYYDFLQTNHDNIGLVVADASGKGMPAALLISQLQATLRSEVRHDRPLSEMIANANYLVSTSTSAEKFVTLFYGELDSETLKLSYCNAGHNYPFVIHRDGSIDFLEKGGLLVGAFSGAKYVSDTYQLMAGDVVFFYTDGLNEAFDKNEQQYGEQRLVEYIKKNRELPPQQLTDSIVEEIRSFAAGKPADDDMTVIVLKIKDFEQDIHPPDIQV